MKRTKGVGFCGALPDLPAGKTLNLPLHQKEKDMTIKIAVFLLTVVLLFMFSTVLYAENAAQNVGEEKFKVLCAMCHPDGGNVVNPKKTLHKADRESNNVRTADDIVKIMRNPGPGMTKFPEKYFPDDEVRKIADYVLKTFN
jgi:cytochrome c6